MSRTTRRTNASGIADCWFKEGETTLVRTGQLFPDTKIVEGSNFGKRYTEVYLSGKMLLKKKAAYHSDRTVTMNNAPKWYRQDLNRKLRSQQRAYLTKCICHHDFDNYSEPRFIKDAAWYW